LIDLEADRTSFIVGVGGGLVTDLAGFVASTFMRGVPFGFVSSTLLGQVDASIGGKNGVNLDGFKNMVGVIRQPEFVWCDLDLLSTLDDQEYLSGVAEVIKYGVIRDREFFSWLEEKHQDVIDKQPGALERTISAAASMKVAIVENDVNEKGDRKLLNFGHTFGHAIEKLSGMLHGYAISIGMVMAARLSVRLGFLAASESDRLHGLLERTGLPVGTSLSINEIFETLLKDKKRSGEQIHFILLKRIGEAFVHPIGLQELKKMMNDLH
jgi:3-dehydroquinate synthase